jgi:hypothetical protein
MNCESGATGGSSARADSRAGKLPVAPRRQRLTEQEPADRVLPHGTRRLFPPTPAAGQNFLYDSAAGQIRSLDDRELFRQLPLSYRICRIYAEDDRHNARLAAVLDRLTSGTNADDVTNM